MIECLQILFDQTIPRLVPHKHMQSARSDTARWLHNRNFAAFYCVVSVQSRSICGKYALAVWIRRIEFHISLSIDLIWFLVLFAGAGNSAINSTDTNTSAASANASAVGTVFRFHRENCLHNIWGEYDEPPRETYDLWDRSCPYYGHGHNVWYVCALCAFVGSLWRPGSFVSANWVNR